MLISHIMRSKIERKESQIGLLCVRHGLKFRNLLVVGNVVRCCAVFSHLPVDRVVVVNVEGGVVGGLRRGGLIETEEDSSVLGDGEHGRSSCDHSQNETSILEMADHTSGNG